MSPRWYQVMEYIEAYRIMRFNLVVNPPFLQLAWSEVQVVHLEAASGSQGPLP